jgi:catalase
VSSIRITRLGAWTLGALLVMQAFLLDVSAQNVYKTVDEQGNVIYTDRPPVNVPVETVAGLDISRTDSAGINSKNVESRKQAAADNAAAQMRAAHDDEDASKQAKIDEKRKENCKAAKQHVTKYSEARRLYRDTGEGEREYLSDAEMDAERSNAVRSASDWCD